MKKSKAGLGKLLFHWPIGIIMFLINLCVGIIPSLLLRLIGLRTLSDKWLYCNLKLMCCIIFRLCGADVIISGKENLEKLKLLQKEGERLCLISNHTSALDIPLFFGPLGIRCAFVAKKELSMVPYINILALTLGCVFMNRKDLRACRKSITKGVERIKNGKTMLIFPEGTRSKTGEIGPFRYGSFRLASESNSTIVPITIKGLRKVFEERSSFFVREKVYVDIGKPVKPDYSLGRNEIISSEREIENTIKETYSRLGK